MNQTARAVVVLIVVFILGWTVGRIDIPDQPQEVAVTVTPRVADSDMDPATRRLLDRYAFLLEACETGEPVGRQGQRAP